MSTSCTPPETGNPIRRSLHPIKPSSSDLLIATMFGAFPMCQELCRAFCVHYFIKSITQSSCYLDPRSPDEESEAQKGKVCPEATEPVNGGAGCRPLPGASVFPSATFTGRGWKGPASSVSGGLTILKTGKWPPRPVLGVSLSIPGKKVKYLRGAH